MYQKFFGFSEKPFEVTPDPRFLFLSDHHQEALSSIIYGIRERRGFITLVGEVGTGKTTLLNATMGSLNQEVATAFIFNTDIDFDALLQMVLIELELGSADVSVPKYAALDRLNRFATERFAAGGNVVLFIDEAQNLDTRTMENLRLLSNLETQRHKLIQIVLSGQPELDEKLRKKELRQFAQRINMRRYITPLNEGDTYEYIRQHVEKAGYRGRNLFDQASLKQVWKFSGGVPRKINLVCDNALLIAYGLDRKKITLPIIEEAVRDLDWSPYENAGTSETHSETETVYSDVRPLAYKGSAIAGILLLSVLLGIATFGFLHFSTDGFSRMSRATGNMVKELFGSSRPDSIISGEDKDGDPIHSDSSGGWPGNAEFDSTVSEKPSGVGENSESRSDGITVENIGSSYAHRVENRSSGLEGDTGGEIAETDRQADESPVDGDGAEVKRPQYNMNDMKEQMTGAKNVLFLPESRPGGLSQAHAAVQPSKMEMSRGKSIQNVVVRKGDYLVMLVKQYYGKNTEDVMEMVIRANPGIKNPDLILPGQVIRMPKLE